MLKKAREPRVPALMAAALLLSGLVFAADVGHPGFQYKHGEIEISRASKDEPKLAALSVPAAMDYVEKGALVWARERKCVSWDFENPASDGHMTGLALLVLRKAGISKQDPRIRRGIEWLRTNQRQPGRWWTTSLNTDKFQFITYSGTAYPILALMLCDEI